MLPSQVNPLIFSQIFNIPEVARKYGSPQIDADTIFDLAFRRKEDLLQPNLLGNRILLWVEEEIRADALPAKAGRVLEFGPSRAFYPPDQRKSLFLYSLTKERRLYALLSSSQAP